MRLNAPTCTRFSLPVRVVSLSAPLNLVWLGMPPWLPRPPTATQLISPLTSEAGRTAQSLTKRDGISRFKRQRGFAPLFDRDADRWQ
jgi:hypothetical protein